MGWLMAKRRHKKRPLPVRFGALATQERCRQLGGVTTEIIDRDSSGKASMKRHRVRIECMLDYYFIEDRIDEAEYRAGMKFRQLYLRVVHKIKMTNLSNPYLMEAHRADPEGATLAGLYSERLLYEAYDVLSPEQQSVVRRVCGYDEYAGGRAKIQTLRRGLKKLADHWSLSHAINM